MQPYNDSFFSDSYSHLPHNEGGGVGHHYITPFETTAGFQGFPYVSPSSQGNYRNIVSQTRSSGGGPKPPTTYWDSSRYGQSSTWLEDKRKEKQRSKIVVLVFIITLVVILAVTISVNVVMGRMNNHANATDPPSASCPGVPDAANQTDPNDPSTFVKDPNLHQAFYGIAYTPVGSQLPDCGNRLEDVIQDIQILSQLTKRIRLYGADCNQTALVLEAIRQTKVDMTVWVGNFVAADDVSAYTRQRDILKQAIEDYGVDHIGGITVGNEFILNFVGGSGDPNAPVGNQGAQVLIPNITDTVNMLSGMSLSEHVPVGNADAGSYFNTQVLGAIEYGMSNIHPYFAAQAVQDSAAWTMQFFQTTNVDVANALPNKPTMYIAETGWPTKSSDAAHANNGKSDASVPNLQIFIDTFVCQANAAGIGYFFFEFCDEDWKDKRFGGVEGWWGLFNQDRTLKDITIPTCIAP